jgi:3-oxoacyl-[acyl-carrier protein] reductase
MRLAHKVALVTGSSRGIGRAIAMALAEEGADVAVHYYGDQRPQAEEVALLKQAFAAPAALPHHPHGK